MRTPSVRLTHTQAPVTRDVSALCVAMVPLDNADDPAAFDGEMFCIYHFLDANGQPAKNRDNRDGRPGPVNYFATGAAAVAAWFDGSQRALCNIEDPQIRTRVSQQLHEATSTTSIDDVLGAIRQGSSVSFVDQTIPLKWEDVLTGEMAFSGFGKLIYQVIDNTLKDAATPREAAAKIATLDQQIIDLGKEATALDRTYKERQSAWTEEDWGNMKALTRTLQQRADSLQKELDGLLAEDSPIVLSPQERTRASSMIDQIASEGNTGSILAKYEGVFSKPLPRSWTDRVVTWVGGEEASEASTPIIRIMFFSLFSAAFGILLSFGLVLLIRYHRRVNKGIGDEMKVYHDLFKELQRSPTSPPEHLKDLDALLKKYKPASKKETQRTTEAHARSAEKTTLATWFDKLVFWDKKSNGYPQKEDPPSEIERLRAFYDDLEVIREKIYVFEEIRQRPGSDTRGTDPEKPHRKRNKMEATAQQKLAKVLKVQKDPSKIDVVEGIEALMETLVEKLREMQDIVEFFSVDQTTGDKIPLAEAKTVAQDTVEIAKVFLKRNPVAERASLDQAKTVAKDTVDIARIFLGGDLTADGTRLIEAQEMAQGSFDLYRLINKEMKLEPSQPGLASKEVQLLFNALHEMGRAHLGQLPGKTVPLYELVHEIQEKLEAGQERLKAYERLQQATQYATRLLSEYTNAPVSTFEAIAEEIHADLRSSIKAILVALPDVQGENEGASRSITHLVKRLIDERTAINEQAAGSMGTSKDLGVHFI